jgi:poly(A)-specific ribonuclease
MDVDKVSFEPRLLQILEALSTAHFVSIDLEMSGVSSRSAGPARHKQSLQERYTELKQAAERYQILQIGLTVAQEDSEQGKYVLRPYNFPLNPCIEEKSLDLERIFSFQSGAVDFLLEHGFKIEEPFEHGVPYLSRDEEKLVKQKAKDRNDPNRFTDMVFDGGDIQMIKFMKKIREETDQWLETWSPDFHQFSIVSSASLLCSQKVYVLMNLTTQTSRDKPSLECALPELTSFDKRIVHQLIRKEYPGLITLGRQSSVTIKALNEEHEKAIQKERRRRVRAQIARQTGFRWIVEAMAGGNLSKIDVSWFAKDPNTGASVFFDVADLSARFNRATASLKLRRPVLVGHNLFTDLVYFYQCFIGALPDAIDEFCLRIHELFPVIVDTKYMATHNCGTLNPKSSLGEIEEALQIEEAPQIGEAHKRCLVI